MEVGVGKKTTKPRFWWDGYTPKGATQKPKPGGKKK